jgi:uncharacterized protein (DUF58 family)
MSLFPADFLMRVEYLSIISRRVFRGSLLAQRRTMQLGSGIEFSDHREYAAGDDFRYLDWNVYARHGDLLLKRFQEEQDLHVYLMLDCSRSMGFGDGRKFDLARQLIAAIAYIALADLDRISVLSFADGVLDTFPLTRGKARILPLMQFLERLEVGGSDTDISGAIQGLLHRGSRRGLAVLVSDFFDPSGFQRGLDRLRHRRFDGHILQLHTSKEADPGLLGDVEFQDVENDSIRKVTVTERNLRSYRELFQEHQQSLREYCRNYGLGCTQAEASVPFDELILHMMRASQVQR